MTEVKHPLTDQEQKVMDLLVRAHNEFCKLDEGHPDHTREWADAIHNAQVILMQRVVRRDYPEYFK